MFSISSEGESLDPDTILGDDVEAKAVTGVDLPLGGRDEDIMDDADGFLHGDLDGLVNSGHVLLSDLVV